MVSKDNPTADARQQQLASRWQRAREEIWRLEAERALQIDFAVRGSVNQLLTRLAADHQVAVNVRELARLAWDELCETTDPSDLNYQLDD